MSMRRLSFTLLCGLMLLLVPAAIAAVGATGDGVLELRDVNATTVTIKGNKGVIWGQIDKGTLRVTDLNPDDNVAALVSGGWLKLPTADPAVTLYTGKNIHFRFPGGRYQLTLVGSGIDFTAVGVGKAWLTGDPDALDDGDYAVDGGKWQPVPVLKKLITFGVQPPVVASP
jgi:hypothetical protein